MDNFFLLVVGILFILLAGFLIFYFQTQRSCSFFVNKLDRLLLALTLEFEYYFYLLFFHVFGSFSHVRSAIR